MQTTAPISRGSSGGPFFSLDGTVTGMALFIIGGDARQNLNFGVPAQKIRALLDKVQAPEPLGKFTARVGETDHPRPPRYGRVSRALGETYRVAHDHKGAEFRWSCPGELVISPTTLRFHAADGEHSFVERWDRVERVEPREDWGAGAVRIRAGGRNFNFGIVSEESLAQERRKLLTLAFGYWISVR